MLRYRMTAYYTGTAIVGVLALVESHDLSFVRLATWAYSALMIIVGVAGVFTRVRRDRRAETQNMLIVAAATLMQALLVAGEYVHQWMSGDFEGVSIFFRLLIAPLMMTDWAYLWRSAVTADLVRSVAEETRHAAE